MLNVECRDDTSSRWLRCMLFSNTSLNWPTAASILESHFTAIKPIIYMYFYDIFLYFDGKKCLNAEKDDFE